MLTQYGNYLDSSQLVSVKCTYRSTHTLSSLYSSHNACTLTVSGSFNITSPQDLLLEQMFDYHHAGVARGACDSSLIPKRYLPTTWFRCIVPVYFSDYRPRPMKAFSGPIWDYRQQQLLCCETAMPEKIRWSEDQNPLLLSYQAATAGMIVAACWRLTLV